MRVLVVGITLTVVRVALLEVNVLTIAIATVSVALKPTLLVQTEMIAISAVPTKYGPSIAPVVTGKQSQSEKGFSPIKS
jgi:hypothetical protein